MSADTVRFPISFDPWYRWLSSALGLPVRLREVLVSVGDVPRVAAALAGN